MKEILALVKRVLAFCMGGGRRFADLCLRTASSTSKARAVALDR